MHWRALPCVDDPFGQCGGFVVLGFENGGGIVGQQAHREAVRRDGGKLLGGIGEVAGGEGAFAVLEITQEGDEIGIDVPGFKVWEAQDNARGGALRGRIVDAGRARRSAGEQPWRRVRTLERKENPARYRSQITLAKRRISAFALAVSLVEKELERIP